MKSYSLLLLIALFTTNLLSQANAYRDFIIAASSKTNPATLVYDFKQVGGSTRFFSDNWSEGYVYPNIGEMISKGTKFNFDYDENTLYLQSITKDVIAINMRTVKKFGILNEKGETTHFGKINGFNIENPMFYEIVAGSDTSDIAIFKTKTIKYIKPDKNDYLRNFNGDYSGTYTATPEYYLYNKSKKTKNVKSLNKKELSIFYAEYKLKLFEAFKGKKKLSDKEAKTLFASIITNDTI
jgi:hypothetical protein